MNPSSAIKPARDIREPVTIIKTGIKISPIYKILFVLDPDISFGSFPRRNVSAAAYCLPG
jgi:hypothetical protein